MLKCEHLIGFVVGAVAVSIAMGLAAYHDIHSNVAKVCQQIDWKSPLCQDEMKVRLEP